MRCLFSSFCCFFLARRSCSSFRFALAASAASCFIAWNAFFSAFSFMRWSQVLMPRDVAGFITMLALSAGSFHALPLALPTTCLYVGRCAFLSRIISCSSTSSSSSRPFSSTVSPSLRLARASVNER